MQSVAVQRRNRPGSVRLLDFALTVAIAVGLVVAAKGQAETWGRRSLSQQLPVAQNEARLTQENITSIRQVMEGLPDGAVLVLAVSEVQLDEPLRLESTVTIRGESTGSRPVVRCKQKQSQAFQIMADHVVLEHLVIVGCGSPAVLLERPIGADAQPWMSTIRDVSFEGNGDPEDFGKFLPSGVFMTGGAVGCADGFDLTVEDCNFEDNIAVAGAGISVDGSSLTVVNTSFTGNVAGGAGFSRGAAISITNFARAVASDPFLEVRSCKFTNNKDLGGSLSANALVLSNGAPLERSQFVQFPTPTASGGAIFASRLTTVEVADSVFVDNAAVPAGGAIFLTAVTTAEVKNCEFSGNSVDVPAQADGLDNRSQGGALYAELLQANEKLIVEGSTFENNSAACGGAIHLVGAVEAKAQIEECFFKGNAATIGGGGVLLRNILAPFMSRVAFVSNVASAGGGLLLTNGAGLSAISFAGDLATKFEGNSAINGGGIAMIGAGVVNLETIPFIGNHALQNGGALAVIDGSINTNVVIERATMERNTASRGGAIFIDSVSQVDIIPNSPDAVNVFKQNIANRGGAIYFEAQSNMQNRLRARKVDFVENLAVVAFDAASRKMSSAGGLFEDPQVASTTDFSALVNVIENRIDRMGELARILGSTTALSPDPEDNSALRGSGGGVFLALDHIPKRGSVSVTLYEASFLRNAARIGGGLMVVMDDGEWVSRCEANDVLTSPMDGRCRAVSLADVEFVDNGAQELGGAISATHPGNIYVFDDARSEDPVKLSDADLADGSFVRNMVDVGGDGNNVGTVEV